MVWWWCGQARAGSAETRHAGAVAALGARDCAVWRTVWRQRSLTPHHVFVQLKAQPSLTAQAPEFTPTKKAPRTPSKFAGDCSEEIHVAAQWWSSKLTQHDLANSEVQAFENAVRTGLQSKCNGHWYPNDPLRGSGHRSLVNDISTDPIFLAAAAEVRIRDIGTRLPKAVMWVNPSCVKVQLDNGRYPETVFSTCASGSNSEGTASDEDDL